MQKVQINLSLLLPAIPDERDACVQRVISIMEKHKGIEKVHLVPASEQQKAQLCFHYDPDNISLARIQQFAREAGAAITEQYGHLLIEVDSIRRRWPGHHVGSGVCRRRSSPAGHPECFQDTKNEILNNGEVREP